MDIEIQERIIEDEAPSQHLAQYFTAEKAVKFELLFEFIAFPVILRKILPRSFIFNGPLCNVFFYRLNCNLYLFMQ